MTGISHSSSQGSANALKLDLTPSRILTALLISLHALSLLVLIPLALPIWILILLAAAVITSFVLTLRTYVTCHGANAIRRFEWHPNGEWSVVDGSGRRHEVIMHGPPYVHPWLTIIRMQSSETQKFCLLLCSDSLDAKTFKMLRRKLLLL